MERKWWTLLAVSVATFMLLLDITVVNVALPSIREDLGASFTDLQWVVDAYVLTLAALVLRAAAGAGAVWRGGGAGGAGRGRHPAVLAGRRLGVRLRPGPWALPGGLALGVWVPRLAAAGRLGGRHRGDPGQGGPGAPPAPTLPAWAAQSPEHPAADRAPHAVLGSGQAADRRRGGGRPAGRTRPRRRRPHPAARQRQRRGRRRQGDTRVNRCGDRTTTRSTLDRHRGLILGGLCLRPDHHQRAGGRPGGPARPARQVRDPGRELLEVRRTDPTTDREITRCSIHRSQGARRQHRGVGSCGSPGGSSGVGRAARSTGAARPAGSCPADTTHVMNRPHMPGRPLVLPHEGEMGRRSPLRGRVHGPGPGASITSAAQEDSSSQSTHLDRAAAAPSRTQPGPATKDKPDLPWRGPSCVGP
jgi:hypothetical protein